MHVISLGDLVKGFPKTFRFHDTYNRLKTQVEGHSIGPTWAFAEHVLESYSVSQKRYQVAGHSYQNTRMRARPHARTQTNTIVPPLITPPLLQRGNGLIRGMASREGGIIMGKPYLLHDQVASDENSCGRAHTKRRTTVHCVCEI